MKNQYTRSTQRMLAAAATCITGFAISAHGQVVESSNKLLANDTPRAAEFGKAVAIDNGIIAVGAWISNEIGINSGSAYLFDSATGNQILKLVPDDGAQSDRFGVSIALDNGLVAVGAFGNESIGAVYIFESTTGTQLLKLTPDDGMEFDQFGISVAMSNGIVAVGSINADFTEFASVIANTGAVYLFDISTGEQLDKLHADDRWFNEQFGFSVAIENNTLIVGANEDSNEHGSDAGSAYIFDLTTGLQTAKLLASDGHSDDEFGGEVKIDNGIIAIGARHHSTPNAFRGGATYLFDAKSGIELSKLVPDDLGDFNHVWGESFGNSIDMNNGIIAIGSLTDDDQGQDSGSAYLFDIATGEQLQKLLPDHGHADAFFGASIALDNGIVVSGSRWDNFYGPRNGAAYVFEVETGIQINDLYPNDRPVDDLLGHAVAIENNIVAVGAIDDDDSATDSGSVYLFDRTTGNMLHKLLPADGQADDFFGWALDIDNGIVVVGSRGDDDNGTNSGSVYLFDADTGTQLHKLSPSDGAFLGFFGWSVAIENNIVAVGSFGDDDNGFFAGAVYLFDTISGAQIMKLLPNDGAPNASFGQAVDINNGIVAVGAWGDNENGSGSGAAYLFDAATGTQLAKLLPDDASPDDQFGNSISLSNGLVAVGSWLDDDFGIDSGAVYLFDTAGIQLAKILPDDGSTEDLFGASVSIDDNLLVVGAYQDDDSAFETGSAYAFNASTGEQTAKLLARDRQGGDEFGFSIDIDQGIAVVGAHRTDDNGTESGSAYLFDVNEITCPADINNDGEMNFFDISAYLTAFSTGNLAIADFNSDGVLNAFDISAFLGSFAAGCQ
ncbi:hypothetical protein COB72_03710 [bacterium]|nr:MAG: hypothetical protein COB72_03710 [bacterium]